jgi:hypothetical protein
VAVDRGDPVELMAQFWDISQQVREIQDSLKDELVEALQRES